MRKQHTIEHPYYPIVYVRGFAMTESEREDTFYDAFYGFAKSAVNKRKVRRQDNYLKVDIFEGQLLRFMKERKYLDASNEGLKLSKGLNPSRSIWVSRFYDDDVLKGSVRSIEQHAEDLRQLITTVIPTKLEERGVDLGRKRKNYRVILIAHSMGGLVCRTLIQNLLAKKGKSPGQQASRWIDKLVTIGTPHGGIEMDAVPESIVRWAQSTFNPGGSNIFNPEHMREYLKLPKARGKQKPDVRSLDGKFPPDKCLCIIGSNHAAYGVVKHATGSHSDGLVKQENAYILGAHRAYVHHPHSGTTGIVNSYESYENIQRFLFGKLQVGLRLHDISIATTAEPNREYFYDFECLIAIRNTGVFVHRREADPCENSIRLNRDELKKPVHLHTGFLFNADQYDKEDTRFLFLPEKDDRPIPYMSFLITLRVKEASIEEGWLWDTDYPDVSIFQQTIEFRLGGVSPTHGIQIVQHRWREQAAGGEEWQDLSPSVKGKQLMYTLNLGEAQPNPAFLAKLVIEPKWWNDADRIPFT